MRLTLFGVAAGLLLVGSGFAADAISSAGPKPGHSVSPFHPLNVTGKFAGENQCLV